MLKFGSTSPSFSDDAPLLVTLKPSLSNPSLFDDVSLSPPTDFLKLSSGHRSFRSQDATLMTTDCGLMTPVTQPILNFNVHQLCRFFPQMVSPIRYWLVPVRLWCQCFSVELGMNVPCYLQQTRWTYCA